MSRTESVARTNGTKASKAAKSNKVGAAAEWADDRLGLATLAKKNLRKVFPDHWSFMLGEIALWSFIVLLLTGVFLTLWFRPSMVEVVYDGSYDQLRGIQMSEAYASSLNLSFDVRGGLLMRQMHHWAAMVFIAAMMVHLLRVFFTGAFRKPRELNWVIGSLLLLLGTLEGFTGYSLPDDLLSGTGIRAADGFMKSMPVVGTYMSFFLFGGEFPGDSIIPRLYTIHVLLIPGILLALVGAHMLLLVYHKHTQWPGPGRTEQNVVGYPMLPVYMAKAGGFFFVVFGVLGLMGALMTINPVWRFGPYNPAEVTAGSQPDWYMGWPDGALRIMPNWETHLWNNWTLSWNVFLPIIVLPGLMFTIVMMLPFLEQWITGDKREHHLLQRPRNAPTRTGPDGRADDLLRHPLDGRRQRHPGDQAEAEHQPDHLLQPGGGVHRAGDRVHHHQTLVHLAATGRQRQAAARPRERRDHARRPGWLHREARRRCPLDKAYTLTARAARRGLRPRLRGRRQRRRGADGARMDKLRARFSRLWYGDNIQKPTKAELEEAPPPRRARGRRTTHRSRATRPTATSSTAATTSRTST